MEYDKNMKGKKNEFKIINLTLLGTFSGFLSIFGVNLPTPSLFFIPGIFFGVIIGGYFFLLKKISSKNMLLFTIGSTGSYFVGSLTTQITFGFFPLVIGGLVGTFLLLHTFRSLIHPLTSNQFMISLLIGTLLSLSGYMKPFTNFGLENLPPFFNFSLLFLLWQAGMACTLGWIVVNKKTSTNKTLLFITILTLILLFLAMINQIFRFVPRTDFSNSSQKVDIPVSQNNSLINNK